MPPRARLFLFLLAPLAIAQQPALPLSLRKSIEIALSPEGNTRVELANESVAQADARKGQARAALLPNLDSSVSYQDATRNLAAFGINFPSLPGFTFSTFAGPFAIFDARTSATQSILDLSSIRRYQSSRAGIHAARGDRDHVRNQVTAQVARAYLSALRAEAQVDAARANLEMAETLRRLAESQKNAGTGTGIEVTRAEVQRANERQRLHVSENERTRSHLELLRALDLKLDTRLELTDKLSYAPVEPVSLDQALQSAIDSRPDLKAQQEREHAARLSYKATAMERLPSVAAFADYGTIGPQPDQSRATRTVGLSLRLPIFDGGRRDARRAEFASQWRQETIRAKDLRQQMELELRIAFDNLRSAELQVAAAEEGVGLAGKEFEQAQRRYKAGLTSSLEVTGAQTRLVRARDNRTSALFQYNLARLDLGSAMGSVERFLP
ncbi:MAG TPA: TolC family protein [Bryobacteraceae bacterium]|nr:TolC family protein [Bryobacteraceae bacterium]